MQLDEGSEFDLADDNDSDAESDETPNYNLGLGLSERYVDVGDFSWKDGLRIMRKTSSVDVRCCLVCFNCDNVS